MTCVHSTKNMILTRGILTFFTGLKRLRFAGSGDAETDDEELSFPVFCTAEKRKTVVKRCGSVILSARI